VGSNYYQCDGRRRRGTVGGKWQAGGNDTVHHRVRAEPRKPPMQGSVIDCEKGDVVPAISSFFVCTDTPFHTPSIRQSDNHTVRHSFRAAQILDENDGQTLKVGKEVSGRWTSVFTMNHGGRGIHHTPAAFVPLFVEFLRVQVQVPTTTTTITTTHHHARGKRTDERTQVRWERSEGRE